MKKESDKKFNREIANKALENVKQKIIEVNNNENFIYRITKAVLFGSYLDFKEEKIDNLDIAIYIELKSLNLAEVEQNINRSMETRKNMPYILRCFYGKEEIFKYVKDKKRVIRLHDGVAVDRDAIRYNQYVSYIYSNKHQIIYELKK